MAQLALGIAGAAIGSLAGPAGAQWGFAIGTALGGALFPPKMPDGPKLNDRQVQSSAYGETIPRIYGSYVVAGNVIWSTDLKETAREEGGKGGPSYTRYTYSVSCAVSLCEGPIIGVRRIWADGKLIYDARSLDSFKEIFLELARQYFEGIITVHYGTEDQLPDTTIQAIEGDTPAYRGEAYVVFTDLQLEKFGNRIPMLRFEVVTAGEQAFTTPDLIYSLDGSAGTVPRVTGDYQNVDPATDRRFVGTKLHFYNEQHYVFDPVNRELLHVFPLATDFVGTADQHRQGVFVERTREYWIMYREARGSARIIWFYIYDADTYAFLRKFDIVSSGAATINWSLWIWKYNPISERVIVYRTGENSWWDIDVTGFLLGTPAASGNTISYDVQIFYNYLVVPSYFSSGSERIDIYLAGLMLYQRSYDMFDYYLEPQTNSFWQNEPDTNICWDTKRNRWFALSRFSVDADLYRKHYAIFDGETGTLTEVGLIQFDNVNPSSVQYSRSTDTFVCYREASEGAFQYAVISAESLQVSREVRGGAGTNYRESALYPGVFYGLLSALPSSDSGFNWYRFSVGEEIVADVVPLKDVVAAECLEHGLGPADIDVTNLTGYVRGFMATGQGTGRGGIEQLMNAYQFDAVESNGKLKFVSRAKAATTTIDIDDIAVHEVDQEVPTPLPFSRADEVTLPQRLTVRYADADTEFQQGVQEAFRYTTQSRNQITMEVPVVMNAGEAKALAETGMYSAWAARTTTKFTTTRKYSAVEPTDVVTINNNAIRISRKMLKGNMIEFEGSLEDATVYAQTPVAGTTTVPEAVIPVFSKTNAIFLDIPILRDADDNSSFYIAANGYEPNWPGTLIFKSTDNENFFELQSLTNGTKIGAATNALGQYDENTFDEFNVVNVRLTNRDDELESKTEAQVLNGSNVCMIGAEILQFKNAVLQDDGTYNLSGLLRGRRSSVTSGHASGDRFILLDALSLLRPTAEDAEINLARQYKAPTIGQSVNDASVISFTNTAIALKPFAPVFLGGGRNGAGDVIINWIRCSRIGSQWRDFVDTSLGETTEAYDIEIVNTSVSPPVVVRTLTATTNTVTYTAAQQTTDFSSPLPASVTVKVYQKSSTYGRGSAAEAVI